MMYIVMAGVGQWTHVKAIHKMAAVDEPDIVICHPYPPNPPPSTNPSFTHCLGANNIVNLWEIRIITIPVIIIIIIIIKRYEAKTSQTLRGMGEGEKEEEEKKEACYLILETSAKCVFGLLDEQPATLELILSNL